MLACQIYLRTYRHLGRPDVGWLIERAICPPTGLRANTMKSWLLGAKQAWYRKPCQIFESRPAASPLKVFFGCATASGGEIGRSRIG